MSEIVFGYLRVSGAKQVDGDGPQRQEEAIRKFVGQHSLVLERVYFEAGVSGAVEAMDRPEFARMLADITAIRAEGGIVNGIVVERIDRLARDLMVSEFLIAECRKSGLKVYAADQGALIDLTDESGDPTRKLIRQIMGALAEWEKTMLVRKMAIARKRIKRETGKCEGQKSFGYYPGEAVRLNRILLLREVFHGLTWSKFAELLTLEGITSRSGSPWHAASVRKVVLANRKS